MGVLDRFRSLRDSPRTDLLRLGATQATAPLVVSLLLRILLIATPTLTIVGAGLLVNAAVTVVLHHGQGSMLLPAALVVTSYGLGLLLPVLQQIPDNRLKLGIDSRIRGRVVGVSAVPAAVAHLEDPELLDSISLVRTAAPRQLSIGDGVCGVLEVVTKPLAVIGPLVVLATWRPALAVVALVATLLALVAMQRRTIEIGDNLQQQSGDQRKAAYVTDLTLGIDAAKELRLFGLQTWIVERMSTLYFGSMQKIWADRRVIFMKLNATAAGNLLIFGVLAGIIVYDAYHGHINAGRLVALLGAAQILSGLDISISQQTIAAGAGGQILRELSKLEAAVANVELSGSKAVAGQGSVRFDNVHFSYPGSDRELYRGLDLELRAGESLAIVGANGAGKTTLVKLLARLYDPTEGQITVDGVPMTELDAHAWQRSVACLFQDFTRFPLSLRENVALGAPSLADDQAALDRALERAGATALLDRLDNGWDTLLSSAHKGGTDLSGGQWQRVALARALLAVEGGARILVLDEPTAALDARAEAELYERFLDITAGVTTVLISHRFSTVRKADRIVVLDGGRVVEMGSHAELLAADGRYAEMFNIQAARFVEDFEAAS